MIDLTCTKCRTVLRIDEAFAGGVCRCQHCGTIQTVPAHLKRVQGAAPALAPVTPAGKPILAKEIYVPASSAGAGTGLDDLAQVVASSGLTGTGLRASHLRKPPPAEKARWPWIAGGAVGLILGAIILTVIFSRGGDGNDVPRTDEGSGRTGQTAGSGSQGGAMDPALAIDRPNFMGLPLAGKRIVYVLDRGSATRDNFDGLKGGAMRSLESLGSDRTFQIIFWDIKDGKLVLTPPAAAPATPANIAIAREGMRAVNAYAQSEIVAALKKAWVAKPDEIIIATGKADLDEPFVKSVMKARGKRTVKIHTVSLGEGASPDALQSLADQTGGTFIAVQPGVLRKLAGYSPN